MLGLSTTGALLATPDIVCVGGPGNAGSGSGKKQAGTKFLSSSPEEILLLISSGIRLTFDLISSIAPL